MFCTGLWGGHPHGFWIIPLCFVVLMLICGALLCRRARRWRTAPGGQGGWGPGCCWGPGRGWQWDAGLGTPVQILEQRYAAGAITREEYEQMRRDIEHASRDRRPEGD